ncbi:MAG: hypothetical protein RL754_1026 [Bacteroidota bacterium]|jgi:tRNA threonylcarbamoyl adenosine modification protein (Sua5/YciO/YrdC/YwlC family)
MVYTLYPENINERVIEECVERFERGDVAIIPTDSVYAIAGDFQNIKALEKLARIKKETVKQAEFSFLFTSLTQVGEYTQSMDGSTFKLVKKLLPGPYTLVLEANINLAKKLGQKRKTIGVRIPDNPIVLALSERLGRPLASTSLHHDDEILQYPTDPEEIVAKYASLADFVIDGGWGDNVPSTVIDLSGDEPELLRSGKGDPDVI